MTASLGGVYVIFVTLTLTDSEWERLLQLTPTFWPGFKVAYNMSRNELTRTLLMSGVTLLIGLSQDQQRDVVRPRMRMLRPASRSGNLPSLPGAPR